MRTRPSQLRVRQFKGQAFGESAIRVRAQGSRNEYDEWIEGVPVETDIDCAVAPVNTNDNARRRILEEGGIRLDAARIFYTNTDLVPQSERSSGDVLRYNGQDWQVREVSRWDDSSYEAFAIRVEGQ